MTRTYNLCIVSDNECNLDELGARIKVRDLFQQKSEELNLPLNITHVWLSDLLFICRDGRTDIILPEGEDISTYDIVLPRLFLSDPELVRTFLTVVEPKELYIPFNLRGYEATMNKFVSLSSASMLGLKVPVTFFSGSSELLKEGSHEIGLPVVTKLLKGYGGIGVMKSSRRDELNSVLDMLGSVHKHFLLQRFVDTEKSESYPWDIRALVIGEKVIGIKRTAAPEEFRTGSHSSGRMVEVKLPEVLKQGAIRIASHFEMDICGVDYILNLDGDYVFLEVNCTPGMCIDYKKERQVASIHTDLMEAVLSFLIEKCESIKEK